jgi:hypothetical protein
LSGIRNDAVHILPLVQSRRIEKSVWTVVKAKGS